MIMHNKTNMRSKQYWCVKLNLEDVRWEQRFSNLFNDKLIPRKIADFNWKVFYGVIPVENRLKQWRKSDGLCKLCNQGLENIEHLFVSCPKLGTFWKHVSSCIEFFLHKPIDISFENIILGWSLDNAESHMINMIVFICKWELWKRRNECVFENNHISWEILWKTCKNHVRVHIDTVLKSKIVKIIRVDIDKLQELSIFLKSV